MNETYGKSQQETSEAILNATSSPESEDGPTLFDSPDGEMTDQSGPGVVPVNRSVTLGRKKA